MRRTVLSRSSSWWLRVCVVALALASAGCGDTWARLTGRTDPDIDTAIDADTARTPSSPAPNEERRFRGLREQLGHGLGHVGHRRRRS